MILARRRRLAALCLSFAFAAGCSTASRGSGPPSKVPLDPEASPLAFRRLAGDAVVVTPGVGQRKLAEFGNYIGFAARKLERARLTVWDDEPGDADDAHKRAEYVKDVAAPDPVDRYLVFGRDGEVIYQRDFRVYPLSELDR